MLQRLPCPAPGCRILAAALLTAALLAGPALAQDKAAEASTDLQSGGFSFKVHCGYGQPGEYSYALPVPNAGLARPGAIGGGLEWQMAYDASVVPLQISIYHRFPAAFKGRVEVECRNSVNPAESNGSPFFLISQEVLVPPGVEFSRVLLPRVSPAVAPGSPVSLTVRLFQGDNKLAVSEERTTSYQLAPEFLYSLWLDGSGPVQGDAVNPGNRLGLKLSVMVPGQGFEEVEPALLGSENFLIPVPRNQLCEAPLAARDFAFVAADLQLVQRWSAAEQSALEAYVIGGGHLLLFNTAGSAEWRGRPLASPLQLARGMLIPVSGDIHAARAAMATWLEGELSEFVLLSGGTAGAKHFTDDELPRDRSIASQMRLSSLLGLYRVPLRNARRRNTEAEAPELIQYPPYEPGYLNPIWIYRQSCSPAMLEPWDYPQFSREGSYLGSINFNTVQQTQGPQGLRLRIPRPAAELVLAPRHLPWKLGALALLPALLIAAALPWRSTRPLLLRSLFFLGAALSAGLLGWQWMRQAPVRGQPLRLQCIDLDLRSGTSVTRSLLASSREMGEESRLELASDSLLRRIVQSPAGDITWSSRRPESWRPELSELALNGGASFSALSSERVTPLDPAGVATSVPLKVSFSGTGGQRHIDLDTSHLPAGSQCMLQSPLGWQLLPSGQQHYSLFLNLPRLSTQPGAARLETWRSYWTSSQGGWQQQLQMSAASEQDRLRLVLKGEMLDSEDEAARLAWLGVLAQPLSGLAAIQQASGAGQGVLWVALPPGGTWPPEAAQSEAPLRRLDGSVVEAPALEAGARARDLVFLRICFPLEAGA